MQITNPNFDIPFYILEQIAEYLELTAKGYKEPRRFEKLKMSLNMAKMNGRLSQEQVDLIMEKYNRE